MFNVVTERRKRSVWTPRTVAASVGAHLLLLGVFVTAAESRPPRPTERIVDLTMPAERRPEPPKQPATPPPPAPDKPQPTKGDFVTPRPPEEVPTTVPPPDPHAPAITPRDVTGIGQEGQVIGTPEPNRPPAPDPGPESGIGGEEGVYEPEAVTVLPRLANEREAQRMLQRVYPPLLRDAGVTGTTVVTLIIDRQGNVEPGSINIQNSTHPGFEDAARRAVEKFRFAPAQLNGRSVSVIIALPIEWRLQN
ncbi:MAG TPA: TonB family protein [Longimicrobium sp.]